MALTVALVAGDVGSLIAQVTSLVLGVVVGRFMRRRRDVAIAAFLACFGAMVAHILYDGQGAFLFFIYMPVVYCLSVVGRSDLT